MPSQEPPSSEYDHRELVARADANLLQGYRTMASTADGGEVWERDGLLVVAVGAPVANFNVALVTRSLDNPDTRIAEAIETGARCQCSRRRPLEEPPQAAVPPVQCLCQRAQAVPQGEKRRPAIGARSSPQ